VGKAQDLVGKFKVKTEEAAALTAKVSKLEAELQQQHQQQQQPEGEAPATDTESSPGSGLSGDGGSEEKVAALEVRHCGDISIVNRIFMFSSQNELTNQSTQH